MTPAVPARNLLLSALPSRRYGALLAELALVDMPFGTVLFEAEEVVGEVYFPVTGVISLVSSVDSQLSLELGMIGSEGMAGIGVFLGARKALSRAVVQVAGSMLVMRASALRKECREGGILDDLLRRYAYSLLVQISTSAVCNQFHTAEVRLARYLLMMHDRIRSSAFPLTQQFLSSMLGVRREGINRAATALQQRGLLSYRQGVITIVSRKRLEEHACECYAEIKAEHRALLRFLKAGRASSG